MTRNEKVNFAIVLVIIAVLCFIVFKTLSKPLPLDVDMANPVDAADLTATTTDTDPIGQITDKPVTNDPKLVVFNPELNTDYDEDSDSNTLLKLMSDERKCSELPSGILICSYSGRQGFYPSKVLTERAEKRAEYLCSHDFSHEGWSSFVTDTKFNWLGENLARNFSDTPTLNDAFMASPTHKANILNPDYQWVGISNKDCGGTNQFGTTNVTVVLFGGYNQ